MLPFASALAIASLGQTLVVMQGGIDLSVAGGLSLYVVIVTKYPAGDNGRLLPAIGIALLAAVAAGSLNGFLIGRMRLNPIVATLGHERVALRRRALVHGRHPDHDDRPAGAGRGRALARHPGSGVLRRRDHGHRHGGGQADAGGPSLRGRRRERDRCPHRRAPGAAPSQPAPTSGRSSSTASPPILHAGIVNQPTAYEGDNYLLPTVAAVVLGGTSLLGGRGNLVATAIAALFLSQLDQFVLALGVTYATRSLVQAGALAVGVALYTIDWGAIARRISGRRHASVAPT